MTKAGAAETAATAAQTASTDVNNLLKAGGAGDAAAIKTTVATLDSLTKTGGAGDLASILASAAAAQTTSSDINDLLKTGGAGDAAAIKTTVTTLNNLTKSGGAGDLASILTKANTINWTDVTAIQIDSAKIAAVKTTVEAIDTKINNLDLDVTPVLAKWGDYKAEDIIKYVNDVGASLGTPSDTSGAKTVFGDVKTLNDKWGEYTASDLYGKQATTVNMPGPAVTPYTVANEVSSAAFATYGQVDALRAELAASGKTPAAREQLASLQASFDRLNSALAKMDAASSSPLYAKVLEIANQLKAIGAIKGGERVASLYDVPPDKAADVEYLKQKLLDLKAASQLSNEIISAGQSENKKPIIKKGW